MLKLRTYVRRPDRGNEGGEMIIHCDMLRELLVALDPHRVPTGSACAQDRRVVRTDDEVVAGVVGKVLCESRRLADVVARAPWSSEHANASA